VLWLGFASHSNPTVRAHCLHSLAVALGGGGGDSGGGGGDSGGGGDGGADGGESGGDALGMQLLDAFAAANQSGYLARGAALADSGGGGGGGRGGRGLGFGGECGAVQMLLSVLEVRPLPEPRHAAYDVMVRLAAMPSGRGLRALVAHAGWVDYMANRSTEGTKEGKEWKFAVVSAAVSNAAASKAAGAALGVGVLTLQAVLRQGPFFVPAQRRQAEVMLADGGAQ
jgi:hypothetical protein